MQALVNEYIASAQPVGSKTLVKRYLVHVSSATVRNELMWLEERGYIISPHTSAGRVPTNVGYRSFVNSLLLHPGALQLQLRAALERRYGADELVLPTIKRVGSADKPIETMQNIVDTLTFLSECVGCLAVMWVPSISPTVYHRGLTTLMMQPEFRETTAALPLVQLLESHGDLVAILKEVQTVHGLHIRIGTEHADTQLFAFSMVASRILIDGTFGVVALFGPTRMDYRRAIASLSTVISDGERR